MKLKLYFLITCFSLINLTFSQTNTEIFPLQNPININYLNENLNKSLPRLVYTKAILNQVKHNIKSDLVSKNMYEAIKLNAEKIYNQPLLERKLEGKRLLHISREFLYRINILGCIYLIEQDEKALNRIDKELISVCEFIDWNPRHFLDIGEMALGVALALDWTQDKLPQTTINLGKKALIEKALNESWPKNGKASVFEKETNNWNQVCEGGLIAAAIVINDINPELASKTISRALDGLPYGLKAYAPNGAYPEGTTYWEYATSFSVVTIAMLESAFGTDFGYAESPGFKNSATFRCLSSSHSNLYYNYFDCALNRSKNGDETLAWFAKKMDVSNFFEKERFLLAPEKMDKLYRFTGAAFSWISLYEPKKNIELPTVWKGDGLNPIVIIKSNAEQKDKYYFGCKGGKASLSHGNMDAGSFIFELNGVRWSIDLGIQNYYNIEKTGFNLWQKDQLSDRWKLLSKNNFGHSTFTVNDALFINNANVPIINFSDGQIPKVSYDLTALYGNNAHSAIRNFIKDGPTSLLIEDYFVPSEKTKNVTWQMITDADVSITNYGALLSKDGKFLKLENLTHAFIPISIISLDPPPLELDSKIKGLKRIEIKIPVEVIQDKMVLKIRLSEL